MKRWYEIHVPVWCSDSLDGITNTLKEALEQIEELIAAVGDHNVEVLRVISFTLFGWSFRITKVVHVHTAKPEMYAELCEFFNEMAFKFRLPSNDNAHSGPDGLIVIKLPAKENINEVPKLPHQSGAVRED